MTCGPPFQLRSECELIIQLLFFVVKAILHERLRPFGRSVINCSWRNTPIFRTLQRLRMTS